MSDSRLVKARPLILSIPAVGPLASKQSASLEDEDSDLWCVVRCFALWRSRVQNEKISVCLRRTNDRGEGKTRVRSSLGALNGYP